MPLKLPLWHHIGNNHKLTKLREVCKSQLCCKIKVKSQKYFYLIGKYLHYTWNRNRPGKLRNASAKNYTYSSTQCPAVAIQPSLMMAPPHRWVDEKPKNDVRLTDTCHGHRPKLESLPPMMRVSGLGHIAVTPHSGISMGFFINIP